MAPKIFFDLDALDLDHPAYGIDEIRKVNPQRHEFEQLTAVVGLFPDERLVIGYRDIGRDEFWVRGHIPGNPIFPGVLMLESAAQLCSFFFLNHFDDEKRFFGFGGVDKVKFRGTVAPGDRFIVIARGDQLHPRRSVFSCQGVVGGRLVFEAEITGVAIA